jgi:hypothetical protein
MGNFVCGCRVSHCRARTEVGTDAQAPVHALTRRLRGPRTARGPWASWAARSQRALCCSELVKRALLAKVGMHVSQHLAYTPLTRGPCPKGTSPPRPPRPWPRRRNSRRCDVPARDSGAGVEPAHSPLPLAHFARPARPGCLILSLLLWLPSPVPQHEPRRALR